MQDADRVGNIFGNKAVVNLRCEKRETLPPDWLLTALREKGVNPQWLLTGQGARMLQSCDGAGTDSPQYVYVREIRPPKECPMEELMAEIFRRASKGINKNNPEQSL